MDNSTEQAKREAGRGILDAIGKPKRTRVDALIESGIAAKVGTERLSPPEVEYLERIDQLRSDDPQAFDQLSDSSKLMWGKWRWQRDHGG